MDRYDEALERARAGMPIDEVFPELKESEDERIRTRLIALVEAFGQGSYKNEMLAYLERQKEPRDYRKLYEEVVKSDWFKENYVGKSLGEEQNPAEWSEKDVQDIQEASDYLRDYVNNCVQGGNSKLYLQSLADRIESLRPQPEQKRHLGMKDQWCCNAAWAAVRDSDAYNGEEKQFILDFLQRCKPQPHWKPSEVQMDALAWYSGNSGVPPTGDKAIKSLYTDLLKLL